MYSSPKGSTTSATVATISAATMVLIVARRPITAMRPRRGEEDRAAETSAEPEPRDAPLDEPSGTAGRSATVYAVIAYLHGTARSADVLVTSGGVGYQVLCPRPLTPGEEVELEVVSQMLRTEIRLYGFTSLAERRLFRALVALPQVGPSAALALLRDIGAAAIAAAVGNGDAAVLSRAQGVGKKVAERVIATLQVPDMDLEEVPEPTPDAEEELVGYLMELGYARGQAQTAAAATDPTARVEARVAAAVRQLHAEEATSRPAATPLRRTA